MSDDVYIGTVQAGNDYLEHHGILGMKWGDRNGPPYPLHQGLHTSAERALAAKAGVKVGEASGVGSIRKYNSYAGYRGVNPEIALQKGRNDAQVQKDQVVRNKNQKTETRTKESSVTERGRNYLNQALSKSKTTLADIRNELASTKLLGQNRVDTYLKAGTDFKRIQTSDQFEDHAYYATYKKHDVDEYTGLFGKNLRRRADDDKMDIYQISLTANRKIRVPSTKNAAKITANLLSDKQFRKDLIASIDDSASKMKRPNQLALFSSAKRALAKNPSNLSDGEKATIYKALNLSLTNHNSQEIAVQNKFYGAMKKAGYGALVDLNDQSYSSYHAKRPMIVFDTSSTNVSNIRKVSNEEINQNYTPYNVERLLKDSVSTGVTAVPNYIRYGSDYVRDYFGNDYKRKR